MTIGSGLRCGFLLSRTSARRRWTTGAWGALVWAFLSWGAPGPADAAILGFTSFEEAGAGNVTGFAPGMGDAELAWAISAGGVDEPDDLQVIAGGGSAGQQFLQIRDSTSTLNGGNFELTFEDVDISGTSSITVSIDVQVGEGSWNSTDFLEFGVTIGDVQYTIVEIRGEEDLEAIEGTGWLTFSQTLETEGETTATANLFQFRGVHNGDDIGIDNVVFSGELLDPPTDDPPTDDPPVGDGVPEPASCVIWSLLALIGAARRRIARRLLPALHGRS